APTTATSAAAGAGQAQTAPPFDEARAATLKAAIDANRSDAASRVKLGDLYFDAERFADASKWYEEALTIDPKDVDASTDLGIAYYYMNQADRALAQFERSLAMDPKHTKTLLNIGIVRAFGKQDLEGAARVWQQVVEIAPDSPEARMARQALQGLRSAHPDTPPGSAPATPPGK
ncbi:MAG: tetratricopeptide repeat protein, partial [Vicinamibacterales bacterium]